LAHISVVEANDLSDRLVEALGPVDMASKDEMALAAAALLVTLWRVMAPDMVGDQRRMSALMTMGSATMSMVADHVRELGDVELALKFSDTFGGVS